jgi:cellobiose phosphorylase
MNLSPSSFGAFADESAAFRVTDPATPRAFDNFLWNDAVMSCVQQTGAGTLDIQPGKEQAIQVFTGIGRICDLEAFGREHLMSRLIYIRDNNTGAFWNVGWEPVRAEYTHFSCEHGLGYTRIESETNGITASLLLVVPPGDAPVEQWRLTLRNRSGSVRNLSVFAYNQIQLGYKWGFESYGDMLYRGAWFNKDVQGMIVQKHPYVAPHAHLTAFFASDRLPDGHDGSRRLFVGDYATLAAPDAVVNGACTNTPGSCEATIAALQFNLTLKPDSEDSIGFAVGLTDSEENAAALSRQFAGTALESLERVKSAAQTRHHRNTVETPDPQFNRLMNDWLKQQSLFGATWCRWGYMGYRDIVQHGMGVCSFAPERTRDILIEACAHMKRDGMALRGWNPVDTKPYSDSTLWLVYTLTAYLKETGDFDLLNEDVPWFDGGSASLLEHIETAMQTLEDNKGAHGLCLIRFGDWNDSLTNIGREGKGESVWLSMAYVHAMDLLAELFTFRGDAGRSSNYNTRAETMRQALRDQTWDGEWFVRCFDDRGEPVGSAKNEEGQIYLNPQSWALISGIADPAQREKLLAACREHLLTPAGYRLLYPPYLKRNDHIGRISYLEPGICENGTVYSHVNAFLFLAQLKEGMADEAYETFRRLSPGYADNPDCPKGRIPPYIYANGYFAPEHRNNALQAEFTWITGSAAWWLESAMEHLIGVRRDYEGLKIQPALPSEWDEVSLRRTFRGKEFEIHIQRTGTPSLRLNGDQLDDGLIPLDRCTPINTIEVTL